MSDEVLYMWRCEENKLGSEKIAIIPADNYERMKKKADVLDELMDKHSGKGMVFFNEIHEQWGENTVSFIGLFRTEIKKRLGEKR